MRHPGGKRESVSHTWLGALWLVIPLLVLVAGGAAWWFLGDEAGFNQPVGKKPPLPPPSPPRAEQGVKPVEHTARIPEPDLFPKDDVIEGDTGFTNLHHTPALSPPGEVPLVPPASGGITTPGSAAAVAPTESESFTKAETFIQIPPITIAPSPPLDPGRREVGKREATTTTHPDPALRPTARLQPEIHPPEPAKAPEPVRLQPGVHAPEPVKAPTPMVPSVGENLPYEEELSHADDRIKEIETNQSVKPSPLIHTGGSIIAMVIDDLGFNKPLSKAIALLPYDITLAVLPGGGFSKEVAQLAETQGKELILHQPMQPIGYPGIKPGPGALFTGMSESQIDEILANNFREFPQAKGLNNHMGSLLTDDTQAMDAVMRYLKPRGLFFLDSRTSNRSVGYSRARALGIPATQRDVFIDNAPNKVATLKKLAELVTIAKQFGQAVGIGHPYQSTLEALREWLPTLKGHNIEVARLSHILFTSQVKKEGTPVKQARTVKELPDKEKAKPTGQTQAKKEPKPVKHTDANKSKPAQDSKPTTDTDDAVQQQKTEPTPKVSIVAD
ncbi:MAG: divergent polysaccharide deacetylase family protein [Magnetococcales bacterium]|nr:divergent polysaccharide deacetylase family protein [Magnetococcales bacterium]